MNVVSVVNLCWWFGVGVFGGAAADGDEERERGQESKNNKKREGSKRARQVPIHPLTPDRPPLAATTMLY